MSMLDEVLRKHRYGFQLDRADIAVLIDKIEATSREVAILRDAATAEEREITRLRCELDRAMAHGMAALAQLQRHYQERFGRQS